MELGPGIVLTTDVQQNTYIGLQYWTEGIEELAMRVDFLLVFLFEAVEGLDRDDAIFGAFTFHRRGY